MLAGCSSAFWLDAQPRCVAVKSPVETDDTVEIHRLHIGNREAINIIEMRLREEIERGQLLRLMLDLEIWKRQQRHKPLSYDPMVDRIGVLCRENLDDFYQYALGHEP